MSPFSRILVPHDFSNHATATLRAAARIVAPEGRIVVLHVVVPFTPVTDIPPAGIASYIAPDELLAGATKQLKRLVEKTLPSRGGVRVDTKVEIGDPYQRIIAASRGMDAIVMSTAGRTGLAHLLIGSVTEKIVRHSLIPVVTLRPEAARKLGKGKR